MHLAVTFHSVSLSLFLTYHSVLYVKLQIKSILPLILLSLLPMEFENNLPRKWFYTLCIECMHLWF